MSKPSLNLGDLSAEERLRLLEQVWESLSKTPEAVPLTDAQREELDWRLDDLERAGAEGIPWEEVLQQIRTRVKYGHPIAAYYYLPRRPGERSYRTSRVEAGMVVDFGRGGRPIGIAAPSRLTLAAIKRALRKLGFAALKRADLVLCGPREH